MKKNKCFKKPIKKLTKEETDNPDQYILGQGTQREDTLDQFILGQINLGGDSLGESSLVKG